MTHPRPTTLPERPGSFPKWSIFGGKKQDFPWCEEFRVTELFPDLAIPIEAKIVTYGRHQYGDLRIDRVPFWNGEKWQVLHDDSEAITISAPYLLHYDLRRIEGLDISDDEVDAFGQELLERIPLPVLGEEPEHQYLKFEDAAKWLLEVYNRVFKPTGRFKLEWDHYTRFHRKFDPRLRKNGD